MNRAGILMCSVLCLWGLRSSPRAVAKEPRTNLNPTDWLILSDFPPFVHKGEPVAFQGGSEGNDFFDDEPGFVFAQTEYEDTSRLTAVTATVVRQVRTTYILHWIEQEFISSDTGSLMPDASTISVGGNLVFYQCRDSPKCTARIYEWRSGVDLAVTVSGGTYPGTADWTPGAPPTPAPCPEIAEILDAYLKKYPSSLPPYPSEEERTRRWCREEVGLILAAVKYRIAMVERRPPEDLRRGDAAWINDLLVEFVRKRHWLLKVPVGEGEVEKIALYHELSPREELPKLKAAAAGYEAWWNQQGYGPLDVPPLPAP